jgi:Predicted Zn-dependent hydrolases of the beta-lactamase fold
MKPTLRAAAGLIILAACRPQTAVVYPATALEPIGCNPESCGDSTKRIEIMYLGVAGLVVRHEGHVLLTAPFFTNPRLARVIPKALFVGSSGPVTSSASAVEHFLPTAADSASVILVGHGHYDHLMDIPYIATRRARSAIVYGGPSVRHMLMGDSTLRANGRRVVSIDSADLATPEKTGRWFYSSDRAFRFMAIRAGHAPTFNLWKKAYTFASGTVAADMDRLPHTADGWKLGEPYAFMIDVMDADGLAVVFRIYFEDAPSAPPLGFPPAALLDERPIDLAVICGATSSNVPATPDSLLAVLRPAAVMVTHWESFFRSQALPAVMNPATNWPALSRSLTTSLPPPARWAMPLPQTTFWFRPNPRP